MILGCTLAGDVYPKRLYPHAEFGYCYQSKGTHTLLGLDYLLLGLDYHCLVWTIIAWSGLSLLGLDYHCLVWTCSPDRKRTRHITQDIPHSSWIFAFRAFVLEQTAGIMCIMKLDELPRIKLTPLPTPLDEAPRLAKKLGLSKLLIKRDDCTTLGMGGNKVRKLEFLMADALAKGADIVMTDGGPQSNHARQTAAACRKLGIERCILFLGGPRFERFTGNLLLDVILGADIRFMPDASVQGMEDAMHAEAEKLRAEGHKPYVIPVGGSNDIGSLGYVNAMRELAGQLSEEDKAPLIFCACGSAGTLAGSTLGAKLFMPGAKVIGISVTTTPGLHEKAAIEATKTAQLLGESLTFEPSDIGFEEGYIGPCYGVPSEAGVAAIKEVAQSEAIILDPVYTGKAMSGLIDMAKRKLIDTDRTVVFLHTGGGAGLFAFDEAFAGSAKMTVLEP